jgi:putative transposase
LWQEAKDFVDTKKGLLILDDTTLDKPYAEKMNLVTYHWSGKHQRVVKGIALLTLLWTDGEALIPCDFRVYDKPQGGKTKNEHFRQMLRTAKERGFAPEYVLMDSWYAALENLKLIASFGWLFLTRLRSHRLVNPDGKGNVPIRQVEIPSEGRVVHLRGLGFVKVFRTVSKDGDEEYFATNDLGMTKAKREELERKGWGMEVYHRALKPCCGVEKAQVRKAVSMLRHLRLALRAFLRLEVYRLRTGVSWYEAKIAIVRDAIRGYLAHPLYVLHPTA